MAACVVCLSGLPGAGKTTLASQMCADPSSLATALGVPPEAVRVHHVCYDAVVDELVSDAGSGCSGAEGWVARWHMARTAAIEAAARLLEEAAAATAAGVDPGTHTLVIMDDNMHMASMRKEVFMLARSHGAAFVHVRVSCALDVAMARNGKRPGRSRVTLAAMRRIAERLDSDELVDGSGRAPRRWARLTLHTVPARLGDALPSRRPWPEMLSPVALAAAWRESATNQAADEEAAGIAAAGAAESREANWASFTHRVDMHYRKAVAAAMQPSGDAALSPAARKALGAILSSLRKRAMERARAGERRLGASKAATEVADALEEELRELFVRECEGAVRDAFASSPDTRRPPRSERSHQT